MSAHSLRNKRQLPDPKTFQREHFEVEHVTFELIARESCPASFALIAGHAISANDRKPLFTGFVGPDMADQLRALAARLDPICFEIRKRDAGRSADSPE